MIYARIRAFHAVAKTGSVNAASKLLSLTQPAITVQVKALEKHHGVSLFSRKGRSVSLTETGKELYAITSRLFGIVEEVNQFLGAYDELEIGRITIGADSPLHVMEYMAAFRGTYPGMDVALRLGNTRKVLDDIVHYHTDVAIISDFEDDSRFFKQAFREGEIVIITSKNHTWANRKSINVNELGGMSIISREEGSGTRAIFENAIRNKNIELNYILEMDTREAIREAVAQDLGIGIILESEIGHDDRMIIVRIADVELKIREHIVCLKERLEMRSIQAFIDLVNKMIDHKNPLYL